MRSRSHRPTEGNPGAKAEATYRAAHARLTGSAMSGMEEGLLPLALLSLRLQTPAGQGTTRVKEPNRQREHPDPDEWETWNWGPYEPGRGP
jgi:hypothetical protein